jgi:ABC-type phosphonate transport system ATPase subunit
MHKLTTELAGSFPNAEHRFERLEKRGMFNGSRAHNRRLVKADWSTLDASYKARVGEPLNPRNSGGAPGVGERKMPRKERSSGAS